MHFQGPWRGTCFSKKHVPPPLVSSRPKECISKVHGEVHAFPKSMYLLPWSHLVPRNVFPRSMARYMLFQKACTSSPGFISSQGMYFQGPWRGTCFSKKHVPPPLVSSRPKECISKVHG